MKKQLSLAVLFLLLVANCCKETKYTTNQSSDTKICALDITYKNDKGNVYHKHTKIRFSRHVEGKIYYFGENMPNEQEFKYDEDGDNQPISILTDKYVVKIIVRNIQGSNGRESYYANINVMNVTYRDGYVPPEPEVVETETDVVTKPLEPGNYAISDEDIKRSLESLELLESEISYGSMYYDDNMANIKHMRELFTNLKK